MTRPSLLVALILIFLTGCLPPNLPSAPQPTITLVQMAQPAAAPSVTSLPEKVVTVAAATQAPTQPAAVQPTASPTAEAASPTAAPTARDAGQAAAPTAAQTVAAPPVAYIGEDGNVYLLDMASGQRKPITSDGMSPVAPHDPGEKTLFYCCTAWSSDGKLLAFSSSLQTPRSDGGVDTVYNLWLYDAANATARIVLPNTQVNIVAWQPGTHVMAYSQNVDPNYFGTDGTIDKTKARGIIAVNADTGESRELVKPERGYSLAGPQWSPDGRYLGFDEVRAMEGRGTFAYYDFKAGKYVAWDRVIGGYQFAPDGAHVAYDKMAYIQSGDERIMQADMQGQSEQRISPADGVAYGMVYSPAGDLLAYHQGDMTAQEINLMVVPAGGEPRKLGSYPGLGSILWSPDGKQLLITTGPYEKTNMQLISVDDGHTVKDLGPGWQPAW